jgi:hypothetical protein
MPNAKIRVNGVQPKTYWFEMHVKWVVVDPVPGIMILEVLFYLQKDFLLDWSLAAANKVLHGSIQPSLDSISIYPSRTDKFRK